jgi:AraC-like DNA-binding protein
VALLDHSPIAPFLRNQMVLLAQRVDRLDAAELASVLDPMIELAQKVWLSALRQSQSIHSGATLYEMAIDLIESHCHKPEFGVTALVRALGCSRAKLYRVFALQGSSVTAAVRNARLQRARQLIEAGNPDTPIGTLAYACGFVDQSTFGKMFRRHFGVSPGRWRRTLYIQRREALAGSPYGS